MVVRGGRAQTVVDVVDLGRVVDVVCSLVVVVVTPGVGVGVDDLVKTMPVWGASVTWEALLPSRST